ncbi:MAG: TetR/AcrR family transcriptional regulator [Bradymonadia bacterium]
MGRPPRNAFSEETVVRVLRAAENTFGAHGYRGARLEDIAAAAGIQRPSLLYHFKSKERLYHSVLSKAFEQMAEVVQASVVIDQSPTECTDGVVTALLTFAEDHIGLVRTLAREMMDPQGVARGLVFEQMTRLVDAIEMAFRASLLTVETPPIPADFPIRAAILQLTCGYLMRVGTDTFGDALWGPTGAHTRRLAHALLLQRP